jgi:hypothetical protein
MNTSHNSPSGFATSFVKTLSNRVKSFSGLSLSSPMTEVCRPPFISACFHKSAQAENCSPYSGSPAAPMTRTSVRCSFVCAGEQTATRKIARNRAGSLARKHGNQNIERRTSNAEYRTSGRATPLDVRCSMFDVRCLSQSFKAVLSSVVFPTQPQSSPRPTEKQPACATMDPSTFR